MIPRAPRRRLATLGASLALHGGVLLAVLLVVSGETELGALFIDLTESASAGGASGTAGPPTQGVPQTVRARAGVARASAPARSSSREAAGPAPMPEFAPPPVSAQPPALPSLAAPPPQSAPPTPQAVASPDPAPAAVDALVPSASSGSGAALPSVATGAPEGSRSQNEESGTRGEGGGTTGEGVSGHGVIGDTAGDASDAGRWVALAAPGGGAVGPGGPGAAYRPYLGKFRQRVQESLRYPLAGRRRGLSGTVHVEIVIRPDGVISAVAIADSSSHGVLDEAAVEAIKRLAPEPFPHDVPPRTLRVRLPVVFALE